MVSFVVGSSRLARSAYRPFALEGRGVTTAAPLFPNANDSSVPATFDTPETDGAKPFDQVPGLRVMPLIGTAWGHFPLLGKEPPEMCTH